MCGADTRKDGQARNVVVPHLRQLAPRHVTRTLQNAQMLRAFYPERAARQHVAIESQANHATRGLKGRQNIARNLSMCQEHQGREQRWRRRTDATIEAVGITRRASRRTRCSGAAGNPAGAHARTSKGANDRITIRDCAATDPVNDSRAGPLSEGGSGTSKGAHSNDTSGAKLDATCDPTCEATQETQCSSKARSDQRRTSTEHSSSNQGGSG